MKEMKVFEIGNLGDHGARRRGRHGVQSTSHSNSTSLGSSQVQQRIHFLKRKILLPIPDSLF